MGSCRWPGSGAGGSSPMTNLRLARLRSTWVVPGGAPPRRARLSAARNLRWGPWGSMRGSRPSATSMKRSTRSWPYRPTYSWIRRACSSKRSSIERSVGANQALLRKKSAWPKTWAITSFCSMRLFERTR